MSEKRISRGLMLTMGMALVVALLLPSLALADKGNPPNDLGPQAVGHVTIPGNPLTIHVATDMSIQVLYAGERQVYPGDSDEADSGMFAWTRGGVYEGRVYGPDFANHDGSRANVLGQLADRSQTGLIGSGTAADPWWVTTVGWLSISGRPWLEVRQHVRYIDGDDWFRVAYRIENTDPGFFDYGVTLFHAADLQVDGEAGGYGYHDPTSHAVGGWNQDRDFLEFMVPATEMPDDRAASHHQEGQYQNIWDRIGTGPISPGLGFNDTIRAYPDSHDIGCGLQWDLVVPAEESRGVALEWRFMQEEEPPPPPPPPPPPSPEFVPEPGSVLLLASGLMGLAGYAGLRKWRR